MQASVPLKPWLPAQCLVAKRAAEPFERIVAEWAETWLKTPAWRVLGTWDAIVPANVDNWTVLRESDHMRLMGRPKAAQSLALAMLGQDGERKYTPSDLRLMRRIAGKALDDLQIVIDQAIGAQPLSGSNSTDLADDEQRYSLLVGVVGGAELAIECSASRLVRIVRATYPHILKPAPLSDRSGALSSESIEFAASLGSAKISVEQFSRLEPGDILVLDNAADDPVRLAIAGQPTELAVTLGESDGKTTFELQEMT